MKATPHTAPLHPWLERLPLAGGHALPGRILPGPMEGVTGPSFCTVLTRHGLARCWITPFIRISDAVPRRARLGERLAPFLATGLPVVAQLMGTEAALLCHTAERLQAMGVVGIDLNCACPSRTVIGSGAGGAVLRTPQSLRQTLLALRRVCGGCGLSVKLRSGFDRADELPAILDAVAAASPDFVVLHYRTVRENYDAVAGGWERLARARAVAPALTLIGSGDITTAADALRMHAQTGVAGVAPARGLLHNPWLLDDIECACRGGRPALRTPQEKAGLLGEIAEAAAAAGRGGAGFLVEIARHMFGEDSPLFSALSRAATPAAVAEMLRQPSPAQ
ncbi:MAG: tRNA-dihydrouridine synthase C [Lentisphaerae bacterium ADurb.BinA184]|nr:MAG: tRNA-dihydrouridine synthase C [Lentisphaerae bacterium ADurb.BinA184]